MGFKSRNGLLHNQRVKKVPEVSAFLDGTGKLDTGVDSCQTARQLLKSGLFMSNTQVLFHKSGPTHWPDVTPSWAWSFDPYERLFYSPLADAYPKQLRYSNLDDRAM